jgi:hypothetical protein
MMHVWKIGLHITKLGATSNAAAVWKQLGTAARQVCSIHGCPAPLPASLEAGDSGQHYMYKKHISNVSTQLFSSWTP